MLPQQPLKLRRPVEKGRMKEWEEGKGEEMGYTGADSGPVTKIIQSSLVMIVY